MSSNEKNQLLTEYRSKRSQDHTPEPFGGIAPGGALRFVVQHHRARALHYDFRLELDGVLKSWAVPKGPSPDSSDKRLAVRTEDHPLDYADFEGHIPPDNYGAGSVIVWDRGHWTPLSDPHAGFRDGKLLFELHGYKLRGKWTLVKTRRGHKDWLLIKERDAYVDAGGTEGYPADSILSGLTVDQLQRHVDTSAPLIARIAELGIGGRSPVPLPPKLALAKSAAPFSRPGWVFEFKYDGYRLGVVKDRSEVTLYSRNGHDLAGTFPEIVDVVRALPFRRFIIDGEAVVHDAQGLPSFQVLQSRGRLTRNEDVCRACIAHPATLYAFDLIDFDGFDLRPAPLVERKALLKQMLPSTGPLRYSDHIDEHGERLFQTAAELGVEGVVAKRGDSIYRGGRSGDWLKITTQRRDDFVVVGFTTPSGSRKAFGALLLAQWDGSQWSYCGRVGSGFRQRQLEEIRALLDALEPGAAPHGAPEEPTARWVSPELVCEVRYKNITADGVLRAPIFARLRHDKEPRDCVRVHPRAALDEPTVDPQEDHISVHFTNTDKLFWPREGYTKADLISYYRSVAKYLLPYLYNRPVVLTRYPDGIEGKSFFQKDAPDYVPEWLRTEKVWSETAQREISYFVLNDEESLMYVANMASIPIHLWSSRIVSLERPDWCILDLDPKQAPFENVIVLARLIHDLCEAIEIPSFVKTSGSTGLHVLIPMGARYTHEQSRNLGELLARLVTEERPQMATIARDPRRRGDKVYIDFLQNRHGQTIAAPFSVRPLPGAPVSMPVKWSEVNRRLNNERFTIKNAARRMKRLGEDPLRGVLGNGIDLEHVLVNIERLLGE